MEKEKVDDGSLKFLNIERNKKSREFNCKEISIQELVNRDIYLIEYLDDVKTRYGMRYLVYIKFNLDDSEINGRKFFTNSESIKYILDKIRELDAFPRKVTVKNIGKKYILE
ncbi:MAG: hypothetical protein M0R46_10390 [Candidatus Muirbacterium halophilum]|nr:hypothetical protein [Candidatus Muirbacterium halophilum]